GLQLANVFGATARGEVLRQHFIERDRVRYGEQRNQQRVHAASVVEAASLARRQRAREPGTQYATPRANSRTAAIRGHPTQFRDTSGGHLRGTPPGDTSAQVSPRGVPERCPREVSPRGVPERCPREVSPRGVPERCPRSTRAPALCTEALENFNDPGYF